MPDSQVRQYLEEFVPHGNILLSYTEDGDIDLVYEFHILDDQMLDYHKRTKKFIPGLKRELGSNLLISNVISNMGFKGTYKTVKSFSRLILDTYPNITKAIRYKIDKRERYLELRIRS